MGATTRCIVLGAKHHQKVERLTKSSALSRLTPLKVFCSHWVFSDFQYQTSCSDVWTQLGWADRVLRPSLLCLWWLSSHLWGYYRSSRETVNLSSAHFNGHTWRTSCSWHWHMPTYLAILSLASSIQSCGEESAPVQPSVLVFKKATQCQT